MTEYIFKNDAAGTLKTAIGTADITLTLDTGDGANFPSPGSGQAFNAVIVEGGTSEWVICTTRSGDSLTVTRNASPSSFNAGATIEHRLHEDALNNMFQAGTERDVITSPDGSLAAEYAGEEVRDTVAGVWYKHITGTTWKALN